MNDATTALPAAEACGCDDFRTSRRTVLAGMGAVTGAAVTSTMFGDAFRQVAYGATPAEPSVLVVLSLRGGADGLSIVVPHGDPDYYRLRPDIGIPRSTLIAQDQMFGLHPRMAPLLPYWQDGSLAAVQAVGLPQPNRSHFSAMEVVEDADPGSSERRGWINRLIGNLAGDSASQGVQIGGSTVPTSLYGPEPVLGMRSIADLTLVGDTAENRRTQASTRTMWQGARGPMKQGVTVALDTVRQFGRLASQDPDPHHGATYPGGSLSDALRNTARLIRAGIGARVVTIDQGDWDMHVQLGRVDWGDMQSRVDTLAGSLAAFMTDLGDARRRVTVVTVSEFGRRVQQNGAQGLDHGYGNMMLLLGAGVRGGEVHGRWPGLGSLVEGDLQVTHDYRSVFAEVVRSRFGSASVPRVFPDFQPKPIGCMHVPG